VPKRKNHFKTNWNRYNPLEQMKVLYDEDGNEVKANRDDKFGYYRECDNGNIALHDFWQLGPSRTIGKLRDRYMHEASEGRCPPTTSIDTLYSWSYQFCWKPRIRRMVHLWQEEVEEQMFERQLTITEKEWEHSQALFFIVDKMLKAAPRFVQSTHKKGRETIYEDGKRTQKGEPDVVTLALNTADMARLEKLASDLSRMATSMNDKNNKALLNLNLNELSDEQLQRIADGEDPLTVVAQTAAPGS